MGRVWNRGQTYPAASRLPWFYSRIPSLIQLLLYSQQVFALKQSSTMNASDPYCQLQVLTMSHLVHLTELHTCKTTSVSQDISFTLKVSLCPLLGTPHPSPDSDASACPRWPPFSTWVSWEGTPFRMSERHRDARGDAGQWFMSVWSLVRMVHLSVRLLVGGRTGSFHVSDGCK